MNFNEQGGKKEKKGSWNTLPLRRRDPYAIAAPTCPCIK